MDKAERLIFFTDYCRENNINIFTLADMADISASNLYTSFKSGNINVATLEDCCIAAGKILFERDFPEYKGKGKGRGKEEEPMYRQAFDNYFDKRQLRLSIEFIPNNPKTLGTRTNNQSSNSDFSKLNDIKEEQMKAIEFLNSRKEQKFEELCKLLSQKFNMTESSDKEKIKQFADYILTM